MVLRYSSVAALILASSFVAVDRAPAGLTMPQSGSPVQSSPGASDQNPKAPATVTPPQEIDGGTPTYIRSETPEERRTRVGNVDPGPNPDETAIFYRYGRAFYIAKFEKKWASFDQEPGYVRPFSFTPFVYELYQQNEKWVWVWVPETVDEPVPTQPTHTESAAPKSEQASKAGGYTEPQLRYLRYIQPEFSELNVPSSEQTIQFEEASDGLPMGGSWRNSLAVADMNGDGHPDLILPPQRATGNFLPVILLGDGAGHWSPWQTVWPYRIDYGCVVAADFNGDGVMDLAFGVHLQGVRVMLGDGKGNFRDASKGLPVSDYPTRRIVVTDLDGDGLPDILAITEGPGRTPEQQAPSGSVRAFLNRNKAAEWTAINAADPKHVLGGDYLATGKFSGHRVPDFIGSSIYFQGSKLIYRSREKLAWEPNEDDGTLVPYLSYYYALATGRLSSKRLDDALFSFVRVWNVSEIDPSIVPKPALTSVVGIDRVTFSGREPKRVPLIRFAGNRPISGMAVADFNGDGKMDVLFTRFAPREFVLLLGDGKGGFTRAKLAGIKAEEQANYDITVADVNHDGRPDVVIMYESGSDSRFAMQGGSVHVFLNRGIEVAQRQASK